MKQTISVKLIARLLLFLSLIFTPIANGQSAWDDIVGSFDHIADLIQNIGSCCLMMQDPVSPHTYWAFSTHNPACNKIFPYNMATCTDSNGVSVDDAPCTDDALYNYISEEDTAEETKKLCTYLTTLLINTNNACKPVIAAATPQPYLDELMAMSQPFIDVGCIVTQLQAADINNPNIFLPGCDPTNPACAALNFNDPFNNPYYYMAPNLIWSYLAGYVYNYPNTTTQPTQQNGFGIRDYVKNWTLAQTFAQNGHDQQGNQIAAQINVFNPNSFLNATNNITSQIIGDLQLALQKNMGFLTNPANNFPGSNLGLLNNKTVTCNPNVTYQVPCCNTPTMSWPDAQANLMNSLNQKMNALLTKQQQNSYILDYFETNTCFKPLDPTKILPLAQINPIGSLSSSTSKMINNLPQLLYVGKVVTNFPSQTAILAAQQEYFTQAALTDQILLTATDVNGLEVSCAPANLIALCKATMTECSLAAEEIAPFNAAATFLATLAIYAVAFELAGAGAGLLVDAELGPFIADLGEFSQILLKVYGVALNVGMFINFSSGGAAWFKNLPVALKDAWSPPLNLITPVNLKILKHQLECSLDEALLEYYPTTSSIINERNKACRYNASELNS